MSQLDIKIRKLQDNGSTFRANIETLYLGGVRSAKVDELRFELPEEWKNCTVTLHKDDLEDLIQQLDVPEEAHDDDFDPDAAKEEIENPVTRRGDIWKLGRHRLMCGDSTDAASVDLLMDGEKADICFTSPPYNAGHLDIKGNERTKKKYNHRR